MQTKNVFSDRRNLLYDKSASFAGDGRQFHSPGPAAANPLSPKVHYAHSCSAILERSRRSRTSAKRRQSLARYDGEMPDSDRWTSVATLKSTLWRTGSQCSWRSTGVNVWTSSTSNQTGDCNRGTSVLLTCGRTESCSSPGDRRWTPGPMFHSHLQTWPDSLPLRQTAATWADSDSWPYPTDGPLEPRYKPNL